MPLSGKSQKSRTPPLQGGTKAETASRTGKPKTRRHKTRNRKPVIIPEISRLQIKEGCAAAFLSFAEKVLELVEEAFAALIVLFAGLSVEFLQKLLLAL